MVPRELSAATAHEDDRSIERREFLKLVSWAAAAVGLPIAAAEQIAEAAAAGLKPSVIWLHFQECTGCTESLLRPACRP